MLRLSFKSLFAVGIACLGATALPSCATNDSMMFILGVYARKQGQCAPKPEADAPIFANGVLDRTFASEYTAALLVGNQITERGSREQLRTETSRVVLKGAEVNLEDLQGNSLHPAFSSTATGFVDASSGTDPSLSIMYASLIPASVAVTLPVGTVLAKVRVFGDTLGGEEVESSELGFPIEICDGCLISYPAGARDLTADGSDYVCKQGTDTEMDASSSELELPCTVGVDIPSPCTVCSGVYEVCQSPLNNCAYNPDANPDGMPCPQ
jgi:hypothetical protein